MRSDIHTFSLLVWIQSSDRNVVLFTFWPGSVFSNCNSLHNVTGAASHQWHWFSLSPFFLFISLAECLHLKQFLILIIFTTNRNQTSTVYSLYLFLFSWCQAIINSTITPNMTFTKTSQKFGQWADSRANTVYGLGFSTEQQLQQVNITHGHGANTQI